jgi:hypothetical protein
MGIPTITFEVLEEKGRCDFILHVTANRIFDESLSARWSFPSRDALVRRFERMVIRVRNPRRSLASVPWPRCLPPYSRGRRKNSFLIGSFRVHRKSGIMIAHTLAMSSSFGAYSIICQGRGENLESQFILPADFFENALTILARSQTAAVEKWSATEWSWSHGVLGVLYGSLDTIRRLSREGSW